MEKIYATIFPEMSGNSCEIDGMVVRDGMSLVKYIQKKKPNTQLEECEGRMCVRIVDFFMVSFELKTEEDAIARVEYFKDRFSRVYDKEVKKKTDDSGE